MQGQLALLSINCLIGTIIVEPLWPPPHVVGVAALSMSANPALTNKQVEQILKDTATDLGKKGYDTTFGFGLVNASKAVEAANP